MYNFELIELNRRYYVTLFCTFFLNILINMKGHILFYKSINKIMHADNDNTKWFRSRSVEV